MEKNRAFALVCILLAALALPLAAEGGSEYQDPVEVPEIGFTAAYKDGAVQCSWKQYLRDDMVWYKLVKSKDNPDPVYPEDGYVWYTENSKETKYVDKDLKAGTWYYRVVIVTEGGERWVSTVVKIVVPAKSAGKPGKKDFAP